MWEFAGCSLFRLFLIWFIGEEVLMCMRARFHSGIEVD